MAKGRKLRFLPCIAFIGIFLCLSCASGKPPRVGAAGENGRLIWSDEFDTDGAPDPEKWDFDLGGHGWGSDELQYYTGRIENAEQKDGSLIISARKESYRGRDYTSARLSSSLKADWLYGRIEVRAKLPKGRGTLPAIRLLPTVEKYGAWPASGEIDVMEHAGFEQGLVHGSLQSAKYNRQRGNARGAIIQSDDCSSAYHVYAIEWRPGKIDFYFDDTLYFSQGIDIAEEGYDAWAAWPFDKPFHLIFNLAVGGDWGGYKGVDEGIWPQALAVDWVRVWDLGLDPAKDTKKPGPPSAPRLYASASGYTLDWLPSRDNYGVDEYRVYMDGELIGGGAKNMIALPMLFPGENRAFRIEARDYNGNASSGGEFNLSAP